MRKCIALCGLGFDPKKKINELSVSLPKDTKVLSVKYRKKDDKDIIYFTYSFPAEAFDEATKKFYPWEEYAFTVCQCSYTTVDIISERYIGDIDIGDSDIGSSIYSVFYK